MISSFFGNGSDGVIKLGEAPISLLVIINFLLFQFKRYLGCPYQIKEEDGVEYKYYSGWESNNRFLNFTLYTLCSKIPVTSGISGVGKNYMLSRDIQPKKLIVRKGITLLTEGYRIQCIKLRLSGTLEGPRA